MFSDQNKLTFCNDISDKSGFFLISLYSSISFQVFVLSVLFGSREADAGWLGTCWAQLHELFRPIGSPVKDQYQMDPLDLLPLRSRHYP